MKARFPCIPAAICMTCLVVAGWTWMRYSYAWDVTPRELIHDHASGSRAAWDGSYVALRGEAVSISFGSDSPPEAATADVPVAQAKTEAEVDADFRRLQEAFDTGLRERGDNESPDPDDLREFLRVLARQPDAEFQIPVRMTRDDWNHRSGRLLWVGRLGTDAGRLSVDTTASRFTRHSITGLVVGAVGLGVFAVYLVRCLNQRTDNASASSGRTDPA